MSLFSFMYFVYKLYSEKCNRYYIGYASNVLIRLAQQMRAWLLQQETVFPIKSKRQNNSSQNLKQEELHLKKQKVENTLNGLLMGIGRHVPINIGMTRNGRIQIHIGVWATSKKGNSIGCLILFISFLVFPQPIAWFLFHFLL